MSGVGLQDSNAVTGDDYTVVSQSLTKDERVVYFSNYLLNGGSSSMNVNGSSTSQTFSAGPSGVVWYLTGLSFFIEDAGTMDSTDFGSAVALTNGVLIEFFISSTAYTVRNLQNNTDIALAFSDSIGMVPTSSGFLDTQDIYVGRMTFPEPCRLNSGDLVRATVRDNVSSLDNLKMMAHFGRVI